MSMKNTIDIWDGHGVLMVNRQKVRVGDRIPAGISDVARKSLKAKGLIKEVIDDEAVDLKAVANDAVKAAGDAKDKSDEAMTALGEASKATEDAGKAVSIAKTANTKAVKAAEAEGATDDDKAKAVEKGKALRDANSAHATAKVASGNASEVAAKLAETAARLGVAADIAIEAAK